MPANNAPFFGNAAQVSTNRLDGNTKDTGGSYTPDNKSTGSGALDKIKAIANNALNPAKQDPGNAMKPDAPDVGNGVNQPGDQAVGNGLNPPAEQHTGSPWGFFDEDVILDFEEIAAPGGAAFIPDGYGGGNWDNAGVIDGDMFDNSGYVNVIQSGNASAFNNGAFPMSFTAAGDETFGLLSGYFAAAWNNDLTVVVEGLRDGQVVGTAELLLGPQPVEINFIDASSDVDAVAQFDGEFTGLDAFRMSSFGGSNAGLDGGGSHFTMDDLVFGVAEPGFDTNDIGLVGTPFWGNDDIVPV
jgi:hypothetical protein